MVQIFLAHAKEDRAKVFELYDHLKRRGYIPWLDKKDLLAGQPWRAEIPKAIKNSDIFIACLSKHSVEKQGYVQQEFRMALNQCARRPPGKIYLVPVRLDDCEIPELRQEEYGINLTDYQWVDLFEPDGFEQLVRSIDHHFPDNPGNTNQTSSDSTVTRETPPTVLQTPISQEPPKETKKGEEQVVIIQEGPKYDLRGAQFAGGFAETVLGDQVGGTIRNESSEISRSIEAFLDQKEQEELDRLLEENLLDLGVQRLEQRGATDRSPQLIDLGNGVTIELVHISGGTFLMGLAEGEGSGYEEPQHEVTVPEFWMGKYPVTQAQYKAVTGKNPGHFKGDDLPVECVNWNDAVKFCKRLSSKKIGQSYRLPTEAEWEYAFRAGTTTRDVFGDYLTEEQANVRNERGMTTPVGTYPPNTYGLYDMRGNVYEWCQDHWHRSYDGAPTDGTAWIVNWNPFGMRVMRGASWNSHPVHCRSASRLGSRDFNLGFRVVCSAPRIPK